jgi:hypothetical protein
MATKRPEVITLTVCDRCDAVLTREVMDEETGQVRKEAKRESFGPVSFSANGISLLEYEEVCGQCMKVVKRVVKKCGPVKRGGYRIRKVRKEKIKKVSKTKKASK